MKAKAFKDLTKEEKVIRKNKCQLKKLSSPLDKNKYSKMGTDDQKIDFIAKKLGLIE